MISIHISILISLCAVVLVLLYISFIQYRRAEEATRVADVLLTNMETIKNYVTEASATLANPQLRTAFESDDEVGTFFKQISEIQEVLDQFVVGEDEKAESDIK